MIVENQIVKVKWNSNNKKIYQTKGYVFTRINDEFNVHIKDVPSTSHYEVDFKCDYCSKVFKRSLIHVHNRSNHFCSEECRERFFNPNRLTNEERLKLSLEGIIILKNKNNKIPTANEYDKFAKENGYFVRRVIQAKTNKNWNELCQELFSIVNVVKKSKECLLNELVDLKNELGRTPHTDELVINGLSDFKTYMRKFNMTYNELILSLGWETNGNFTSEMSKEFLLDKYHQLYKKLGRIPFRLDIENEKDFPVYNTFIKKFESIANICKLLEIPISNNDLNSIGYGISLIDDNNELCRSIPEMIITNYLIRNNISYIKEYHYYKIIKSDKTKRRFDWYLPKLDICIEYFGMYDENSNHDIFKKYRNSVNKKLSICNKHNVKLVDLYREDLEDNHLGLINKFSQFGVNLVNSI